MEVIYRRAQRIIKKYELRIPVTEPLVDQILEGYKIVIVPSFPLAGRIREIVIGRYVFVQHGLDPSWRKWVKVHALYHRLYHTGNQLFLDQHEPLITIRQERQANVYTGFVLVGHIDTIARGITITEAAVQADVPLECAHRWWGLVDEWMKYTF